MNDQIVLAAMLDKIAQEIALGRMGDVSRCVIFLEGGKSNAILTFPQESDEETLGRLERAKLWMHSTGELPQ
jgi:hypothetical protein